MPFNLTTEMGGLFGFLRRYGALIEEIKEILGGFKTTTAGVYNPVNYPDRWKNTKAKPYVEDKFEFHYRQELPVISFRDNTKKFKLSIAKSTKSTKFVDNIHILKNIQDTDISSLNVFKRDLSTKKATKLKVFAKCDANLTIPLNINIWLKNNIGTPLNVLFWLKRNLSTKLGVQTWITSRISDRLEDKTYLFNDVGTISDVEMLEIIESVEDARGY